MPLVLDNLRVVLVGPRFPENIGAAARALANMGIGGGGPGTLRVVAPERFWPEPMERMATSQGKSVLDAMEVHDDLGEALQDCVAAFATTARQGRGRGRLLTPRQAGPHVLEWADRGPTALVFGPEDRGLTTREMDHCHASICIPTSKNASLNLAQAVIVLAYEMRMAAAIPGDQNHRSTLAGACPAPLEEFEALKIRLTEALVALNVIRADNPEHFFMPFKQVLERAGMTRREIRAWHGLARQALWMATLKKPE